MTTKAAVIVWLLTVALTAVATWLLKPERPPPVPRTDTVTVKGDSIPYPVVDTVLSVRLIPDRAREDSLRAALRVVLRSHADKDSMILSLSQRYQAIDSLNIRSSQFRVTGLAVISVDPLFRRAGIGAFRMDTVQCVTTVHPETLYVHRATLGDYLVGAAAGVALVGATIGIIEAAK
jgi:hypothetical protein